MITADYDANVGAWVEGFIYLPTLRQTLDLRFLIDTGASLTAVSSADIERLGIVADRDLPLRDGDARMSGLGGEVEWSFLEVGLAFVHDDGGLTQVVKPIAVVSTPGIPSLLGRDILALGSMHYDGISGSVTLEFEQGLFRLA